MSVPAELGAREVRTAYGAVRILVGGSGPVVLYLHGVGDTGGVSPLLARLAARRTVVRPDHPGFLGSDPLGCGSVRDVAERHLALLDALDVVETCTVVGSSFGGWVAAELALLAPERVAALVLLDPAGLRGAEPAPDIFGLAPEEVVARSFHDPRLKGATPGADALATVRGNLAAAERLSPVLFDASLAGRLRALSAPTTVVWGAEDEILPASYAEEWRAAVPHARIEILAEAGHVPHVERLEEVLALLE